MIKFLEFCFNPCDLQRIMSKFHIQNNQPTITCSKLTIETGEQGVKYVNNKLTIKTHRRR